MKQKDTIEHIPLSEKEISQNRFICDSLKKSLDAEVNELDSTSSAKLISARYRALEQLQTQKQSIFTGYGRVGLAVAVAASIVITVTLLIEAPRQVIEINTSNEATLFENLNILASSDSVEFYQSLDFLIWLENESDTQG